MRSGKWRVTRRVKRKLVGGGESQRYRGWGKEEKKGKTRGEGHRRGLGQEPGELGRERGDSDEE
jgi:hypothetical protein